MAARAVRGLDVLYFILIFVWEEREVDADRNGASNFNVECGMSTALLLFGSCPRRKMLRVASPLPQLGIAARYVLSEGGNECRVRVGTTLNRTQSDHGPGTTSTKNGAAGSCMCVSNMTNKSPARLASGSSSLPRRNAPLVTVAPNFIPLAISAEPSAHACSAAVPFELD